MVQLRFCEGISILASSACEPNRRDGLAAHWSGSPFRRKERKMTRLVTSVLVVSLMSSPALAQAKRHLFMFKTEHEAQQHCKKDTVVWADTRTHILYLPRDRHCGHTHGSYVCESQAPPPLPRTQASGPDHGLVPYQVLRSWMNDGLVLGTRRAITRADDCCGGGF